MGFWIFSPLLYQLSYPAKTGPYYACSNNVGKPVHASCEPKNNPAVGRVP
jgi:hypothetical protein